MAHKSADRWAVLLSEYHQENMKQREFCEKHGVSVASLQYHLKKERDKKSATFIPVVREAQSQREHVEIKLSNGTLIRIPS